MRLAGKCLHFGSCQCWIIYTHSNNVGNDMTMYCELALKITPELNVEAILTLFAVEHFNGREAVSIDSTQYGVDNGLNDLRAVLKPEAGIIAFCCRYSRDVARTEAKVLEFSQKHNLATERYVK